MSEIPDCSRHTPGLKCPQCDPTMTENEFGEVAKPISLAAMVELRLTGAPVNAETPGDFEIPEEAVIAAAEVAYGQIHHVNRSRILAEFRAVLEAALPALRKQWAEDLAAKADQIAEGHQKTAEDHRRISLEVGSAEPKGQRHMRTALAFKERAAGAWEAAHAVREFGEGP